MFNISQVPIIEVDDDIVACHGTGMNFEYGVDNISIGHPVEYLQLNRRNGGFVTCPYCGLRYMKKQKKKNKK